jgi:hypothetical protein
MFYIRCFIILLWSLKVLTRTKIARKPILLPLTTKCFVELTYGESIWGEEFLLAKHPNFAYKTLIR